MLSPKQLQQPKFSLGETGEQIAVKFLTQQNFHIIDTNVRFKHIEVDIIAQDLSCDELVFIEVKTRSSGAFGHPSQAISQKKLRSLFKLAQIYSQKVEWASDIRIDVVSVTKLDKIKINHLKNVSWLV